MNLGMISIAQERLSVWYHTWYHSFYIDIIYDIRYDIVHMLMISCNCILYHTFYLWYHTWYHTWYYIWYHIFVWYHIIVAIVGSWSNSSRAASPGKTTGLVSIIEQLYRSDAGRRPVPDSRRYTVVAPFLISSTTSRRGHREIQGGTDAWVLDQKFLNQYYQITRYSWIRIAETARFPRNIDFGGWHWLHCQQTFWV
jgi:hypothetical protein